MHCVPMSRRRFLCILLGIGAVAFVSPAGRSLRSDRVDIGDGRANELARLFKNRRSAETVGLEYLKQAPEERDVNLLLGRLLEGGEAHRRTFMAAEASRQREMLRRQVRDDFARGRVVKVGGWILSLTETRLCALAVALGVAQSRVGTHTG